MPAIASKIIFAAGKSNSAIVNIVGAVTTSALLFDRPPIGVSINVKEFISLDNGVTWIDNGGFTADGTIPSDWPGKLIGAPMPTQCGVLRSRSTVLPNGKPAKIVMANPMARADIEVLGGSYNSAVEFKAF